MRVHDALQVCDTELNKCFVHNQTLSSLSPAAVVMQGEQDDLISGLSVCANEYNACKDAKHMPHMCGLTNLHVMNILTRA